MARERMVTRTISNTTAHIKACDLEKGIVFTTEIDVGGMTDSEHILKYVQKNYDTATVKHLAIESCTVNEQIWAMTESDFMKYAKPIEKR